MTSKRRAYLKGCAMTMDTILHIGKAGVTPELTESVNDIKEMANLLAERTHSEVVQVIGRKIVLFRQAKENSKYEEEK